MKIDTPLNKEIKLDLETLSIQMLSSLLVIVSVELHRMHYFSTDPRVYTTERKKSLKSTFFSLFIFHMNSQN